MHAHKTLIFKKALFVVFLGISFSAKSEKPPEPVMRNIDSLSMVHAALSICVNGADRKFITANESYARRKILIDIEELVRVAAEYYKTDILYSAFTISSVEYRKNPNINSQIKNKYTNSCSTQLFDDSKRILIEAKKQFSIFQK